jgi:hypothetical protein
VRRRKRHLDAVFSLMLLNETLLALPFCIHLACTFPLGLPGTAFIYLSVVILKPVPLQDVFLLPVQSVETLASLVKAVGYFVYEL